MRAKRLFSASVGSRLDATKTTRLAGSALLLRAGVCYRARRAWACFGAILGMVGCPACPRVVGPRAAVASQEGPH